MHHPQSRHYLNTQTPPGRPAAQRQARHAPRYLQPYNEDHQVGSFSRRAKIYIEK